MLSTDFLDRAEGEKQPGQCPQKQLGPDDEAQNLM